MQTIAHLTRRLAVVTAAVPLVLLGGTVSASANYDEGAVVRGVRGHEDRDRRVPEDRDRNRG